LYYLLSRNFDGYQLPSALRKSIQSFGVTPYLWLNSLIVDRIVKGENTRLRHHLARLHRKTLCYSKSETMLAHSIRLLVHYLKFHEVPHSTLIHTFILQRLKIFTLDVQVLPESKSLRRSNDGSSALQK
jgi:hypothetical protein